MRGTLKILGLAVLAVLVLAACAPSAPKPATQVFDLSIGHQDSYARSALVEAGAPAETNVVTFYKWNPSVLVVFKGDTVILNVTNDSKSRVHSFILPAFGLNTGEIPPKGETAPYKPTTVTLKFVADKAGTFQFACGVPPDPKADPKKCSPEHEYQTGTLIVLER